MERFEIPGSGFANGRRTAEPIGRIAAERGVAKDRKKFEDTAAIGAAAVMATPAAIAGGETVHAGGVPAQRDAEFRFEWPAPPVPH